MDLEVNHFISRGSILLEEFEKQESEEGHALFVKLCIY